MGNDERKARRVLLNVPYSEKTEAKALGAWWDPEIRRWFVPAGSDARPFERWLPKDEVQEARVAGSSGS